MIWPDEVICTPTKTTWGHQDLPCQNMCCRGCFTLAVVWREFIMTNVEKCNSEDKVIKSYSVSFLVFSNGVLSLKVPCKHRFLDFGEKLWQFFVTVLYGHYLIFSQSLHGPFWTLFGMYSMKRLNFFFERPGHFK